MASLTAKQVYEQLLRHLSPEERSNLLEMVEELAASTQPKRDIMEMHGLAAEIWQGIDAQDYLNKLREDWDRRA